MAREFENSLTQNCVAAAVIFENIYYFFLLYRPVFLSREVYLRSIPPHMFLGKSIQKQKKNSKHYRGYLRLPLVASPRDNFICVNESFMHIYNI